MKLRTVCGVALAVTAGCGGKQNTTSGTSSNSGAGPAGTAAVPEKLWSVEGAGYYADLDFTVASAFTPSLALITKQSTSSNWVIAVDPASGKKLWTKDSFTTLLHPPGATAPLFIHTDNETTAPMNAPCAPLIKIDPMTGNELGRTTIKGLTSCSSSVRMVFAGNRIYRFGLGEITAIDPAAGVVLWTKKAILEDNAYGARPIGMRMVMYNRSGCRLYNLEDGSEIAKIGPDCHRPSVPHDRLIAQSPKEASELDENGKTLRTWPGQLAAASGVYTAMRAATSTEDAKRAELVVYEGDRKVHSIMPTGGDDVIDAVTITGDELYWFRGKDKQLMRRNLRTGVEQPLHSPESRVVISPDASGVAGPYVGTPPLVAGPYVFVQEHNGVIGYKAARL